MSPPFQFVAVESRELKLVGTLSPDARALSVILEQPLSVSWEDAGPPFSVAAAAFSLRLEGSVARKSIRMQIRGARTSGNVKLAMHVNVGAQSVSFTRQLQQATFNITQKIATHSEVLHFGLFLSALVGPKSCSCGLLQIDSIDFVAA